MLINLSEKIELILHIFDQCQSDTRYYSEQQKLEEKKENDIRHEMEGVATTDGCPPKYERRAVLATQWQNSLIARRVAKDSVTLNQPLLELIESDIGKNAINRLKQILGETRKIENNMKNRRYYNRVSDGPKVKNEMNMNLEKLIRDWKRSKKRY